MKILHTAEFYYPSVGGAQEVVKQLSEHMVMLGHDVTVATTKMSFRKNRIINGVKIAEFDVHGNEACGYTGHDISKYQNLLVNGNFDVIMNYAAQQWTTDLTFQVIDQIKAKKVLVPCGFSGLFNPIYGKYFHDLPSIMQKYDRTIYLSHDYRDINFAHQNNLKNLTIIENGADEREFANISPNLRTKFRSQWGIKEDDILLLTIGNHTGMKGHKEAISAFRRANIQNGVLLILGGANVKDKCYKECVVKSQLNNFANKLLGINKRIYTTSLSRQMTIAALQAADIFLFLSNIECSPLVLFEAAASGLPFVASDSGNAKEIVKWTKGGMVVNSRIDRYGYSHADVNLAAQAIEQLADDKKLRQKMSQNGRRNWQSKYTWEIITQKYLDVYKGAK